MRTVCFTLLLNCLVALCPATAAPDADGIRLTLTRAASSITLQWTGGAPPFTVYRSITPATVVGSGSALGQTSISGWIDSAPAGNMLFYLVTSPTDASLQIQAARTAAPGPVNLPIEGALVTYVKPSEASNDPAGFFLQATPTGPGLFVAVDAASLSPPAEVGDQVRLNVTYLQDIAGVRQATAVSDYSRLLGGISVGYLEQDLSSAVDIVSALDSYESELSRLSLTLTGAFVSAGTGYLAANADTWGISGNPSLRFRTTPAIVDGLDLGPACSLLLDATPLWRFNTTTQPTAWNAGEIAAPSCPAPKVVSALATSLTAVQVNFDRRIAPSSLVSGGSQFALTDGLTATAATLTGARQVTVSTTSQIPGLTYTVSVSGTLRDTLGSGVSPTANTALFKGYRVPATLLINEVNPNVAGSKDLIEILAIGSGSTFGFTVEQDIAAPVALAALPDISVIAGDIIVVHMSPGTGEGPASETVSKTQYPAASYASNYDTAWDVNGSATGVGFANRILVLRSPSGVIQDAVAFVRSGSTTTSFPGDLQSIQAHGQWIPSNCGGMPCTYTSTPTAVDLSVDWTNVGTSRSGNSVQRYPLQDTNAKGDWKPPAASTFGYANP